MYIWDTVVEPLWRLLYGKRREESQLLLPPHPGLDDPSDAAGTDNRE
jgi:hypothetical protein